MNTGVNFFNGTIRWLRKWPLCSWND